MTVIWCPILPLAIKLPPEERSREQQINKVLTSVKGEARQVGHAVQQGRTG
jgi:hypothetical protein